jgi:hypothetical protein
MSSTTPDGPAAHDLADFIARSANQLAAEYKRIRARAREDPGTAGDEGEENWRELLESWLPSDLVVTTKGRIIGANGELSRQLDVVVLRPGYPKALIHRKVYLAGGVLAAFECKLTLKPAHVAQAAANARLIRRLSTDRVGTPYAESHASIIVGILAHSADLGVQPLDRMDGLLQSELDRDAHPREVMDAICVADLGCWRSMTTHIRRLEPPDLWNATRELHRLPDSGGSTVLYMRSDPERAPAQTSSDALWALIERLNRRIAWELPGYQAISQYLTIAQGERANSRSVASRSWPFDYLSESVRSGVVRGGLTNRGWAWDPWGMVD